jgi:hypothetical protein
MDTAYEKGPVTGPDGDQFVWILRVLMICP